MQLVSSVAASKAGLADPLEARKVQLGYHRFSVVASKAGLDDPPAAEMAQLGYHWSSVSFSE